MEPGGDPRRLAQVAAHVGSVRLRRRQPEQHRVTAGSAKRDLRSRSNRRHVIGQAYVVGPDGPRAGAGHPRAARLVGPHAVLPAACATGWPTPGSRPSRPTSTATAASPTRPTRPRRCSPRPTRTAPPTSSCPPRPTLRDMPLTIDGPIGVLGFSMGGSWAMWLATRAPETVAATTVFYGSQDIDFEASTSAFLGHFAEHDEFVSEDQRVEMEAHLRLLGQGRGLPPVPRHRPLVLRGGPPARLRRRRPPSWPGSAPSSSSATTWGPPRPNSVGPMRPTVGSARGRPAPPRAGRRARRQRRRRSDADLATRRLDARRPRPRRSRPPPGRPRTTRRATGPTQGFGSARLAIDHFVGGLDRPTTRRPARTGRDRQGRARRLHPAGRRLRALRLRHRRVRHQHVQLPQPGHRRATPRSPPRRPRSAGSSPPST